MSASLPNGSIIYMAATYGTAKVVSALSNAAPPVATSTAHGLTDLDVIEITSGWSGINERISRVIGSATNALNYEGLDTTSTTRFTPAGGAGSVRKVLTWVEIAQITGSASSGGEQNFAQWVYLSDGIQRQKPTFKNARSLQLTMADDDSLACYPYLRTADDDGLPRAVRIVLPDGGVLLYNMFISFNDEPTLTVNEIMSVTVTMSQVARFLRL